MGRHDFAVTGGYDPARDGDQPQWGRVAVECQACGETRRIWQGLSLADPGLTYGCPATRIVAGSITCERIVAWRPAPYPLSPSARPPATPATPAPFAVLLPQLEVRRLRRVSAAITLGAVALVAFMVACVAAGWWPPLAVSWGAIMCDAGLITWGIVDRPRPPV